MNNSVVRFPKTALITSLAIMIRAVECALMVTGITAAAYVGFQSVVTVIGWIRAL